MYNKEILLIFSMVVCFYSCNTESSQQKISADNAELKEECSVEDFYNIGIAYMPKSVDFSDQINVLTEECDLEIIFSDSLNTELAMKTINIIFLKLYYFHLQKANQGYNLFTMAHGNAGLIIDMYVESEKLSPSSEWFNSGFPYVRYKKLYFGTDSVLDYFTLIIDEENQRIENNHLEVM